MCRQKKKNWKSLFLEALNEKDSNKISEFAVLNKSKESDVSYHDFVKSLKPSDLSNLWENIFEVIQKVAPLLLKINDSSFSGERLTFDIAKRVLQCTVDLADITVENFSSVPLPLLPSAVFLHDIFLRFPSTTDILKNSISLLCEKFWLKDLNGKEELILNSSFYIMNRTLQVKGKKCDVKRVSAMKDAIKSLMMNGDKVGRQDLLPLCKHCITSPLYLSCTEGCKFLEFLMCLDISLIETFHDAIKLFLPSCSLNQSELYGTLYYNSWMRSVKGNLPDLKEKLELSCLQDFMYHAVHIQRNRPRSLVPLLRKLLAVFHNKKKEIRVQRMLRDLYEPILWRALRDANGNVRANACQIFFDVFPLEDPDFDIADTETELQRQFLIIKDLLTDECPSIRSISAVGVCVVMSYHWELFPSELVHSYFKILIEDLACDSSSAEVRCAVIKGVRSLLIENQLSVPVLKFYLPRLSGLFHDISDKVRIMFCHLLLSVKKNRFIKFYDIVPIDHLLARLEEDKPVISKLIVQLIGNNYLPIKMPQRFWLLRCIELIKTDKSASKVFFYHLPAVIDVKLISKFITYICRMVCGYIKSNNNKKPEKKKRISLATEDKENQIFNSSFDNEEFADFSNPEILSGLIDAVTILWIGIQNSLQKPENKVLYKEMVVRLDVHIPPLLKSAKKSKIYESALTLCSFIPPPFASNLPKLCMMQIRNLPEDAQVSTFGILLTCLCNHGKSVEVLELIKTWLHHELNKSEEPPAKRKKVVKKMSKASTTPKPFLGIKFLHYLLYEPFCQIATLKNAVGVLKEIVEFLKPLEERITQSKGNLTEENKNFLLDITLDVIKITVILQGNNVLQDDSYFRNFLSWTCSTFFASGNSPGTSSRKSARRSNPIAGDLTTWKDLGFLICESLLKFSNDIIVTGLPKENISEYIDFAKKALESEFGPKLLKQIVTLIYQVSAHCKFLIEEEKLMNRYADLVNTSFTFVVETLGNEKFSSKLKDTEKSRIKAKLKELLSFHIKYDFVSETDVRNLVNSVFHCAFSTAQPLAKNIKSDPDFEVVMPEMSSLLLSLLAGNCKLVSSFLEIALSWRTDKDLSDSLIAFILIVHVVQENKGFYNKLENEMNDIVKTYEELLNGAESDEDQCMVSKGKQQLELLQEMKVSSE